MSGLALAAADNVFETPLPYFVFGSLVGLTAAAVSRSRWSVLAVIAAGLAAGGAVVIAAEWEASRPFTTSDPLTASVRAFLLTCVVVGALVGAAPVAYIRLVRRAFRLAEERLDSQ